MPEEGESKSDPSGLPLCHAAASKPSDLAREPILDLLSDRL